MSNKLKPEKIKEPLFVKGKVDKVFLITVLALLCIGLIMMFSASYPSALKKTGSSFTYIESQAQIAVGAVGIMFFVSFINYKWYRKMKILIPALYIIAVALLAYCLVKGVGNYGEKRWIILFGGRFNFQPSEIAKTAVIFALALYISKYHKKMHTFVYGVVLPVLIVALPCLLIVLEPHLSATILVFAVGVIIMIVGGTNLFFVAGAGALGVAGLAVVVTQTDYMASRIKIWLHPESDALGKGFQTLQSLYAIGSGGLTGLGLGNSRQKYLYLPEPQNDYIFSIVCEELGFIGGFLILCLFALLIYRGYVIALKSKDKFGSILVIGIITRIAIQVVLNLAVVTNAIPVTGISLPFFSYGGTALMMLLGEIGIVLAVSRQSNIAG